MTDTDLAARIDRRARLQGEFRLRSGEVSGEYSDKYLFESDPELLAAVAAGMARLLPVDIDALAGLELGGIPLATVISQLTGISTLFVRKHAKDYGTCRLAEGGEVAGRRLVIVEDVVTTAGQIVQSCRQLRELGATVSVAVCAIDREAGGAANLASTGVQLRALLRRGDLDAVAAGGPRPSPG